MKIRETPTGRQISWQEMISLPIGAIVRDLEGETGDVVEKMFEGKQYRYIAWDDGCITSFLGKAAKKTGIWRLR
jgi:hypothetical protein